MGHSLEELRGKTIDRLHKALDTENIEMISALSGILYATRDQGAQDVYGIPYHEHSPPYQYPYTNKAL